MRKILCFFYAMLLSLSLPLFSNESLTVVTENDPATLVDGVSVITGDFYLGEEDYRVAGAEPIPIRRFYVSAVGGIDQYPHLMATFALALNKLSVHEPNGTEIIYLADPSNKPRGDIGDEFYSKKRPLHYHSMDFARTSPGVSNTSTGIISAKTQLKNQTIVFDPQKDKKGKSFTLYASDGTIRRYARHKNQSRADNGPYGKFYIAYYYKLVSETLPNGRILHYEWDDDNRLVNMRTSNPGNTKTLAYLPFPKLRLKRHGSYSLHGSDGRILSYFYDQSKSESFALSQVTSPEQADQYFQYSQERLSQISLPNGRTLVIEYEGGKVSKLWAPLGINGSLTPYYSFIYKDHMSECFDALGHKTQYFWNSEYRLTRINRFEQETTPQNSETFIWEGTNLRCKVFYDEAQSPVFAKTFAYDPIGNILEEVLWGNLSGRGPPLHISSSGFPLEDGVEKTVIHNAYEGRNLLTKRIEPNGLITEITYLPHAQLPISKTLSAQGKILSQITYTYDSDHTLIREEIREGDCVHKIREIVPRQSEPYIALPDLVIEKYVDHGNEKPLSKIKFHYTKGALVSQKDIYDAEGSHRYSLHYKYDDKGRLLEETNALGQKAVYAYNEAGNKTYYKDFSDRLEIFLTYDLANRLIEKREKGFDGIEQVYYFAYDLKNNLISETDSYNNITEYEYDFAGRKTKTIHPLQQTFQSPPNQPIEQSSYNAVGSPSTQIDALGFKTQIESNLFGKPTRITHPDGATEENVYNIDGTLALHIDPLGIETHYRYDPLGHLIEKRTEEAVDTYFYQGHLLLRKIDAEGSTTSYTYDGAGRKTSETLDKETTQFTYNSLGYLASQIEQNLITSFSYDLLGRTLEEKKVDLQGNFLQITQYAYDTAGNQTAITQALQSIEHFEYDSLNRLIKKIDPLGAITTITYNTAQNDLHQNVPRKVITDPLDLKTIEVLDANQRVACIEKKKSHTLLLEAFYYDANGQKIAQEIRIHRPDGPFRYILNQWEYDKRQRLKTLIEGNGSKTTRYAYDLGGHKISEMKPDSTTLFFEYNRLGHLTRLFSSNHTVDHQIHSDKLGRPIAFDNITRTLDSQGRILEERFANNLLIQNSYDPRGRKIKFAIPQFDLHIDYSFGPLYLNKVCFQNWIHEYTSYDLAGNLLSEKCIDGKILSRTYDLAFRPLSLQTTPFTQEIQEYDAVGNILRMSINGHHNAYTYDALYQLSSEQGEFNHNYTFDSLYNRLLKDNESYTLNALNQIPSHCLYDLNGNPIQIGNLHLSYDTLNRLICVQTPKTTIHYTYDYFNRCLSRTEIGQFPRYFLYDGQNEIGSYDTKLQDFRVLANMETAEIGAAIALLLNNQVYTPIHDLQGNLALLDSETRYRYNVFGEEATENPPLSPWRFSSKRTDPTTQFINYGRRYYLPLLGRWLTPDPLEFTAGSNFYAFVQNAPLTHLDEYGLLSLPLTYKAYQEPPDSMKRFGAATLHEIGTQTFDTARFIASTPYQLERGFNYLSGRDSYTFANWNEKQNQFFNRAEEWMYRAIPTDRAHPDYLMYRGGISGGINLGTYLIGSYGLAKGGLKLATMGANAWKFKKGAFIPGEKLAKIPQVPRELAMTKNIANPFKGKTFEEIEKMFINKGFKSKGPNPLIGKGSYFNPKTGRRYYLDPAGIVYRDGIKELPHVDIYYKNHIKGIIKKKLPLGEQLYETM